MQTCYSGLYLVHGRMFTVSQADRIEDLSCQFCNLKQLIFIRQVIAKTKGLDWKKYKRLGDLHSVLNLPLSDMIQLVNETLHKEPYSKQEVCEILKVTEEELNSISLSERTYDSE